MLLPISPVPDEVANTVVPGRLAVIKRIALIVAIGSALYLALVAAGVAEILGDIRAIRDVLRDTGWFGPVAVVALMTIAVVLSPLPSAPIALASGALYGHTWGTVYVVIGAELGALIAFAIARYVRPAALTRWLEGRLSFGRYGSQDMLMVAVGASRLLPFLSFDLVSYAAGLTPLRLWRFALATLIGILPASFTLAHFGDELGSFDIERIAFSLVALTMLGALPWIWPSVKRWVRGGK